MPQTYKRPGESGGRPPGGSPGTSPVWPWAICVRWRPKLQGRVPRDPHGGGCFLLCSGSPLPELWRGEQSGPLGLFHVTDTYQAPAASNILWAAWFQTPSVHLTAVATVHFDGLQPQQASQGQAPCVSPGTWQAAGNSEGTAGRVAGRGAQKGVIAQSASNLPPQPLCPHSFAHSSGEQADRSTQPLPPPFIHKLPHHLNPLPSCSITINGSQLTFLGKVRHPSLGSHLVSMACSLSLEDVLYFSSIVVLLLSSTLGMPFPFTPLLSVPPTC